MPNILILEYEIEISTELQKQLVETLSPWKILGEKMPHALKVEIGARRLRVSTDLGLSTTYTYNRGLVRSSAGEDRHRTMPVQRFMSAVGSGHSMRRRWRAPTNRTCKIGRSEFRLDNFLYASSLNQIEVDAAGRGLPYSVDALRLLWAVLVGSPDTGQVCGIPVSLTFRSHAQPDEVLFAYRLKSSKTKKSTDEERDITLPIEDDEVKPIRLGSLFDPAEASRKPAPENEAVPLSRMALSLLFQNAGGWVGAYMCKIGAAFGEGFLEQTVNLVNAVANGLGIFQGGYDTFERRTVIPFDIWPRLEPRMTSPPVEIDALKSLIVAGVCLAEVLETDADEPGGTIARAIDREGGVTDDEWERLKTLQSIFNLVREGGTEPWEIPLGYYNLLPGEVIDEVLLLLNTIRSGAQSLQNQFPALAIDRETTRVLAFLFMLGVLNDETFSSLAIIAAVLNVDLDDLNYALFDRRSDRREEFVDAQLGSLMSFEANLPGDLSILSTGQIHLYGFLSAVEIGLDGAILANPRIDGTAVRVDLTIPWLFADIRIPKVRLHHGADAASDIAAILTLGISKLFTEASGNLQLPLTNTTIRLRITPIEATGGIGLEASVDGAISWENEEDSDIIAFFPFPVGEIIVALGDEVRNFLRNELRTNIDDALASALTDDGGATRILPWPDLLKLLRGPTLMAYHPDDAIAAAWETNRSIWATLVGETGPNGDDVLGELDLGDVNQLGYVFTPSVLADWILRGLGGDLAQWRTRSTVARNWATDADVSLPPLADYDEPAQAEEDESTLGTLAGAAALHILVADPNIGTYSQALESLCGPQPPVDSPERFFQLRLVPFTPQIEISPNGEAEDAGIYVIRCEVFFEAILRKQHRRPIIQEGTHVPSSLSGGSSSEERIITTPGHPGFEERPEHGGGPDNHLDPLGNQEEPPPLLPSTAPQTKCEWSAPITREYLLETLLYATAEISGPFLVGYSATAAQQLDTSDPFSAISPTLAIAPKQEDGSAELELRGVEVVAMVNAFSDLAREDLEALIGDTVMDQLRDTIGASAFGRTAITGQHRIFDALTNVFLDFQPAAVQNARLIQQGASVAPDGEWDSNMNAFRYFKRNGHSIWPVQLDLDLQSMF